MGLGGSEIMARMKSDTKNKKSFPFFPLYPLSAPAILYFPLDSSTPVERKSAGFKKACAPK